MQKSKENPIFKGLTKNLLHFFSCGRLLVIQMVGLLFRTEEVGVNRSFAVAQDDTGGGEK